MNARDDIIEEFLVESAENIDRLDIELLELEEDPGSPDLLAGIFRHLHMVEGTAGYFGFFNLQAVANAGQDLLRGLRSGELVADTVVADALLCTVDAIRSMLERVRATSKDGDEPYTPLIETLHRLADRTSTPALPTENRPAETRPADLEAVVELELDGTVRTANDRFLAILGYQLDEIVGRHHRIFVEPAYAGSADYGLFWDRLAGGRLCSGEYKRIARDGSEVWITASYNPILDARGRPFKVVAYATDISDQVRARQRFELGVAELLAAVATAAEDDRSLAVAHPIGPLANGVDTLLTGLRASVNRIDECSTELGRIVESVVEAAGSLSHMVDQIQDSPDPAPASQLVSLPAGVDELRQLIDAFKN